MLENKVILKVKINGDGSEVTGLYSDDFPWRNIGELFVERASDVFFDSVSKVWRIKVLEGSGAVLPVLFSKRGDAIAYERTFLEKLL